MESAPVRLTESRERIALTGGPLDEDGYQWPICLIKVGQSANTGKSGKHLYYTAEALRAAVAVGAFNRVRSYANHPTRSEEQDRPERDVNAIIAAVTDTRFDEATQSVVGVWKILDETTRTKVRNAHRLGVIDVFGFSIYTAGTTALGEVNGEQFELVTDIPKVDGASVDFVTAPAAGGGFDLQRLAASVRDGGHTMKFKTLAELRASRARFAATLIEAKTDDDARALLTEAEADPALVADVMAERKKIAEASTPCPSCGKDAPQGAAFCPHCGASMLAESKPKADPVAAPVAEAKPAVTATPDPAVTQMLAEARRFHDAAVKRERDAAITRLVAGFTPTQTEFLRSQLERAIDEPAMVKLTEGYRSSLSIGADVGFPAATVYGAGAVAGPDSNEKYLIAFDGYLSGEDEKDSTGTTIPRLRSLREACMRQPKFGGRYVEIGPLDLFRECKGWYHGGFRNGQLASYGLRESRAVRLTESNHTWLRESATTSGFGEVWADRAYKRMMKIYHSSNDVKELLPLASDKESLPDFKSTRIIRIGEYANPSSVTEGGTYQAATTPADNEELTSLTKYGFVEDITMEALLGEDGKKLRTLPDRMIQAVLRLERQTIINRITTTNPTLNSDSVALYHAGTHVNLLTTALSVLQLAVIERAMMQQASLTAGEQLGTINRPKYIIIPPELLQLTERIIHPSVAYTVAMNTDSNTVLDPHLFKDRLTPIVADHFTNAGDYYLMADPAKMPTFQISRLAGVTQPEFFTQESEDSPAMFDSDKIRWKVRTFLGVEPLDFRSFHFSDV